LDKRSLTSQTKLLVLNFPNNPTGYTPSHQEFDAILGLAQKHGVTIFADEMYRLLDVYEKSIALSGLSKSFTLPSLRLGWLATRQSKLIERWLTFKEYTTICNNAPTEILGIIALQDTERILQRNLDIIRENIASAGQFFHKHRDKVAWESPRAGSIAFPKWLGSGPVEQFCQGVLGQQGVKIVPGALFDLPGKRSRIGLGRKNFSEALEHVDEYLSLYQD
jgi:aspartate/methionine/tyrosine aminotransferase